MSLGPQRVKSVLFIGVENNFLCWQMVGGMIGAGLAAFETRTQV